MATETEEINIGEKEATDIAVAEAEKKANQIAFHYLREIQFKVF
jgi:hypothetical protein